MKMSVERVLLTALLSTAYLYVVCRRLSQTLTGITAASTIRKNTLVFATTAMAANQVCDWSLCGDMNVASL
jgi:hypothetical protein